MWERRSGNGIVPPWIQGMAAKDTFQAQPAPSDKTVFDDSFICILGARRVEAARGGQCR